LNKLLQIFNRIPFIRENKGTKEYDNKFQNELMRAVLNSGTAINCVNKRGAYIFGEGFVNELGNANQKQSFNKLLSELGKNVAVFKTVSLLVKVGIDGMPNSIKLIPTQKIKVKSDGSFMYNPTLYTDNFDLRYDEDYPAYSPYESPLERKQIVAAQMKLHKRQLGFIYYAFEKGIGSDYYAIPQAYSGLEDILTDHELSAYELENLQNGFLPSAILTLIGTLDNVQKDAVTGLTEAETMQKNLKQFTSTEDGRSKLLVMAAETKDQIPNLQQLDVGKVLEGMEKITDRVGRKVCRLFDVPPVLVGFEDASILGSNQTFKNALTILQHSVTKDQELIIESLNEIFPEKNFEIKPLTLIDYIPQEVLAVLTRAELRALGGYQPDEGSI
jgi:hypothetical protein